MAVRTIASFVAYKPNAGGDGVPLIARGAEGTVHLADVDGRRTETTVPAFSIKTGGLKQAASNIHGVVEGFAVDAPEDSPGVYFVSGSLETEMQRFLEGSRGRPGLPGSNAVPTDEAVGDYLSTVGSATNSEAKQLTRNVLTDELDHRTAGVIAEGGETRAAIGGTVVEAVNNSPRFSQPTDPTAFIDNIRVLTTFRLYDIEGSTDAQPRVYMQGFSINESENELYVALGGGSRLWQRFEVRDLATGERKSYRQVTSSALSYTEGLPWFKNGSGHLCFIVRLKPSATIPSTYQVYNYTQDTLGPSVQINGKVRGDVAGDYYVTTDAYGGTATTFWVYEWESVKAGTPTLLATVPISNPGKTAAKMQGMATTGGTYYLTAGATAEAPTVTAYDWTGQLLFVRQWPRAGFAEAVNAERPGLITKTNYEWEAEGATNLNGRLVTGHIIGNGTYASDGKYERFVIITEHGDPVGSRVEPAPITDYVRDTGWVDVECAPGFVSVNASRSLQYRVKDGLVFWRGAIRADPSKNFPTTPQWVTKDPIPDEASPTRAQRFWIGEAQTDGYVIIERGKQLRVSIKTSTDAYVEIAAPPFLNT